MVIIWPWQKQPNLEFEFMVIICCIIQVMGLLSMDSESRLHLVHPPCAILIVVRVCSLIGCDIHIYMITVPTYISTMHSHILLAAHV